MCARRRACNVYNKIYKFNTYIIKKKKHNNNICVANKFNFLDAPTHARYNTLFTQIKVNFL